MISYHPAVHTAVSNVACTKHIKHILRPIFKRHSNWDLDTASQMALSFLKVSWMPRKLTLYTIWFFFELQVILYSQPWQKLILAKNKFPGFCSGVQSSAWCVVADVKQSWIFMKQHLAWNLVTSYFASKSQSKQDPIEDHQKNVDLQQKSLS